MARSIYFCMCLVLHGTFLKTANTEFFNENGVQDFRKTVQTIRDDILGVATFQDYINTEVKMKTVALLGNNIAREVAKNISIKFAGRVDAVKRIRSAVSSSYTLSNWGNWYECCNITDPYYEEKYDSRFKTKANIGSVCTVRAQSATDIGKVPDISFLRAAQKNLELYPGIKWQYFGSDTGVLSSYPSTEESSCSSTYDNRFRPWYVKASSLKPKDIVIVIDRSGSMLNNEKMEAAKLAAITVLNTLSPNDRVSVITFSTEAFALGSKLSEKIVKAAYYFEVSDYHSESPLTGCFETQMATATPANIHRLVEVVKQIVPLGDTNYGKALKIAFDFLQEAFHRDLDSHSDLDGHSVDDITEERDRVIQFLSDGEPSDLPARIFRQIQTRNRALRNSVVFLCYALGKAPFGAALMRMASQKFMFKDNSYLEENCQGDYCNEPVPPVKPGFYFHVNSTKYLRSSMGLYYSYFASHNLQNPPVVWSVPYFDAGGLGMVLTAASPVVHGGDLVGVVGVDITMQELLSDVTYFRVAADNTYAFLVDLTGRVLMHPLLPVPAAVDQDPVITGISAFERSPSVLAFINEVLHLLSLWEGPSGRPLQLGDVFTETFTTKRALPGVHDMVVIRDITQTYSCSSVRDTVLVLCVVVESNVTSVKTLAEQLVPDPLNFLYHRYDIIQPSGMCKHQEQAVTSNRDSTMLSPSAFSDSGEYSELPETLAIIHGYDYYMKYGQYQSKYSPTFKPGVRDSVMSTSSLRHIWESSRDNNTDMSNHVIWTYFGSEQGVFRILPGVEMPKLYDPKHRPWYQLGHQLLVEVFKNKIPNITWSDLHLAAISPPYPDANGGGLVLTVSRAITEPMSSKTSTGNDIAPNMLGVMGGDISLAYFETLLLSTVAECSLMDCAAIDNFGYIIYDQKLTQHDSEAIKLATASNYHIIHAYPLLASRLIFEKIMVASKCVDVASVTYRKSFVIDIDRLREKGSLLSFYISHVMGTNVILVGKPRNLADFHSCVMHKSSHDLCDPRPSYFNPAVICESPCIDNTGTGAHYASCSNEYNYTWELDPPPCAPIQLQDDYSDNPALNTHHDINPDSLDSCSGSGPLALAANGRVFSRGTVEFVAYVVGAGLVLFAVILGLHRRRIMRSCR